MVMGIHKAMAELVAIEPWHELFAETAPPVFAESRPVPAPAFHTYTLAALPGDGQRVDGLFDRTPEPALREYRQIATSVLQPCPAIALAVDDFAEAVGLRQRVGVHVRSRFDFANKRPPSAEHVARRFGAELAKIAAQQPVYLATDCYALRRAADGIAGVACWPAVDFSQMVVAEWRTAFCEMLALSRCERLIVTAGSTFSECAWWLGGAVAPVAFL